MTETPIPDQAAIFAAVNAAAAREGAVPLPPPPAPTEEASEFLRAVAEEYGGFSCTYTLPNGKRFVFEFPASITALQDLGTNSDGYGKDPGELPEYARDLGEAMLGAAYLMGKTNTAPGLDIDGFLWLAKGAGRVFFNMAPQVMADFRKAMALQPAENVREGKED